MPKSRFSRLAKLARAGARTGATLLLSKDARKSALKTTELLGQLRGVATKIGQMMSYVDGLIPPEHRDAFEQTMAKLQSAAPESDPAEIRALVEKELGAPITELFQDWNDKPVASASIGQVHKATLEDGRVVAVKVQHPGIVEAMDADLRNANVIEMILSLMGTAKFDSKRLTEEVKERFREELDYTLEAKRQNVFREIHKDDPLIRIPAVIDERSSKRVFTTEWLEGLPFEQARLADEKLRRSWAETLWRFVYRANIVGGLFNADPHPGNYFFQDDGGVGFVDFGCVQPIENERLKWARQLHTAAHSGDQKAFDEAACGMLDTRGGKYEEMVKEYAAMCFRPITDSPFHLTQDFAASLVQHFKDMAVTIVKTKNDNFVPMPPGILFINRLQFGFFSVLARLDVEADYAAAERTFLKDFLTETES